VCCSVMHRVAVCCSVLQRSAVYFLDLQCKSHLDPLRGRLQLK